MKSVTDYKCLLVVGVIVAILSLSSQEVSASRSRKHHRHVRYEEDGNSRSVGVGDDENTELRRVPGKYICMEDEDEQERLKKKNDMHCKCPKTYAPVCGSDSVTYHNRCFMQCVSKYKYEGFSRVKLQVEKWGPCDPDHEMPVQG